MFSVSNGSKKNPIKVTYNHQEKENFVRVELGDGPHFDLNSDQISFLIPHLSQCLAERIKDLTPAPRERRKFPPLTPYVEPGS